MINDHWWEHVGPNGLPRFYVFLTAASKLPLAERRLHHINLVEVKPDANQLPRGHRSSKVKRVLLRTKPVERLGEHALNIFRRAERVAEQLNTMPLSLMVLEPIKGGVEGLFEKLWHEDVINNPD